MNLNSPEYFQALCDAIENTSCVDDVRGYRGSEMTAEPCLGVVVDRSRVAQLLMELAWYLRTRRWRNEEVARDLFEQLVSNVRTDSLGEETMIIYFPDIKWRLVGDEH